LSRNKDRLGGGMQVEPDTSPPPALTQQSDSGDFSFVVPTEFIALPSKGVLYPEGHPLKGEDCIEIKQMTAKEEDLLTSKTLLKKGVAIDRLVQSLIVDKRIKVDSLLLGDKNAVIIAIRKSGYGSDYSTKINCPACGATQRRTFNLNNLAVYHGDKLDELNVTNNNDGTFSTVLPKTKLTVRFRLLTGQHEKQLVSGLKMDRQQKSHERAITRQLRNMLVSVNDNPHSTALNYLVENIPSMDSRHLRLCYKLACPDIDMTQEFVCEECDHDQDLEVPLTAEFFWPQQ
tara:strand:- start:2926 stop:3789 length:864 start_codon:yes stop_codon:yes gene_type:complete